jgi:CsoR family transcriptional regulator, copper-sensing transcriptional repressor
MPRLTNPDSKRALMARLARVEGQLRGVQRLVDLEADCEEVSQQLSAARKALDKAFFNLIGCMIEQGGLPPAKVSTLLSKFA